MSELNTKAQVYAEVIKQDTRLFRASVISQTLSLTKQLTYYHLTNLVNKGILEKQGTLYLLMDRDKLLDEIVTASSETRTLQRSDNPPLLAKGNVKDIQDLVDVAIYGRALNLPESMAVKTFILEKLDETIDELKKERSYLINKQASPGAVRKLLRKEGENDWYESWDKNLSSMGMNWREPFEKRLDKFVDIMQEED